MDQNKSTNDTPSATIDENTDSYELGYQLGQLIAPKPNASDYKAQNAKHKKATYIKIASVLAIIGFVAYIVISIISYTSGIGNVTKAAPENASKIMQTLIDEHALLNLGDPNESTYQDAGCGKSLFAGKTFCNRRINSVYSGKTLPQISQKLIKNGWKLEAGSENSLRATKDVGSLVMDIKAYRDMPSTGQLDLTLETNN